MKRWVESSPLEFVKLNAFQQVMRLWDEVHPYNAVQATRLSGEPDVQRIQDAWRAALKAMGIGRVIVRGDSYAQATCPDADPATAIYDAPAGTSIDQILTAEMKTAMSREEGCPFRAFVLPQSGSYLIGINYHHWVADSYSIRWLMREWFERIVGIPTTDKPALIADKGPWHYFGPTRGGWDLGEGVLSVLRRRSRFARARLSRVGVEDGNVGVSFHEMPRGIVKPLTRLAKRLRVTLNDLLLATIGQTADEHGANPAGPGRDELGVGTVVDLRSLSDDSRLARTFGLFLGTTTTLLRGADLKDWPRLLRSVARQNSCHKLTCAPQVSTMLFAIGVLEARRMSARRWAELYRRRMPLAAAISNVNMNRHFAGAHHPEPILEYIRVAPTGPMLPLLVTTTTLGEHLNFTLTRQTAAIDDNGGRKIAESITNRLIQLADHVR